MVGSCVSELGAAVQVEMPRERRPAAVPLGQCLQKERLAKGLLVPTGSSALTVAEPRPSHETQLLPFSVETNISPETVIFCPFSRWLIFSLFCERAADVLWLSISNQTHTEGHFPY